MIDPKQIRKAGVNFTYALMFSCITSIIFISGSIKANSYVLFGAAAITIGLFLRGCSGLYFCEYEEEKGEGKEAETQD